MAINYGKGKNDLDYDLLYKQTAGSFTFHRQITRGWPALSAPLCAATVLGVWDYAALMNK